MARTPAQIYRQLRRRRAKAAIINLDATGPSTSAEAQAVLDRMSALTETEEAAITTFVDAEVSAGNWALIDEFYCFALNGTDWLTGFKAKTATNNGAVRTANGASFSPTKYINSNWNPSADGVNYTLNSALFGVYAYSQNITNGRATCGCSDTTNHARMYPLNNWSVNQSVDANYGVSSGDNALEICTRTGSSVNVKYVNGSAVDSNTDSSSAIPNLPMFVGCQNLGGSPNAYSTSTLSTFIVGGAVGFNQSAHNTNVSTFLTALGVV